MLNNGLNLPLVLVGMISNRENIGKTGDERVAKWNKTYPDEPVVP